MFASRYVPRAGLALVAFCTTLGCATVHPVRQVEESVPLRDAVSVTSGGSLLLRSTAWDGDVLEASVEQERLCSTVARKGTITKRYAVREVTGLTAPAVLGSVATAGGAVSIGLATKFDHNTIAYSVGAGALALGIGELVYTIVKASKGSREQTGPPIEDVQAAVVQDTKGCGIDRNPDGRVEAWMGSERVARLSAEGSNVRFDVASLKPEVCSREDLLGQMLVISFHASDQGVQLGNLNLDDCIRSTMARWFVEQARERFARSEKPSELILISSLLAHAERLGRGLPTGKPERVAIEADITDQRGRVGSSLESQLDALVASFDSVPKTNTAELALVGKTILAVGQALPNKRLALWRKVFGTWAEASMGAPSSAAKGLVTLLEADEDTATCLVGTECALWLGRAAVDEIITPFFKRLAEELDAANRALLDATDELRRVVTERNGSATKRGVQSVSKHIEAGCSLSPWDSAIRAACEAMPSAVAEANQVLASSRDRLFELQMESTSNAWNDYVNRCRRVMEGWSNVQALTNCDARCQAERNRLLTERRKLDRAPDGPLSNTSKRKILEKCRALQCPRCP